MIFTHSVLLYLEDLGFCKKGEAGEFVERPSRSRRTSLHDIGGVCRTIIQVRWVFCCSSKRCDCVAKQVTDRYPMPRSQLPMALAGSFSTASTVVLARD